jgi:hypothetical protein
MTYQIVRFAKGKKKVLETGTLKQLTNRLKQLRSGTRSGVSARYIKYKVRYEIEKIS